MTKILIFLGLLGLLGLAYLSYSQTLSNNAVEIAQAQAAIQAARAAQDAAQAAQIAAAGLSATSLVNSLILLALVTTLLLLAAGGLYYLVVIRRQAPQSQWLPGPNARWGKVGAPRQARLPAQAGLQAPTPQDLVNLMLYQQLIRQGGALPALTQNGEKPPEDLQW
jgi:hypothetical protein